MTRMRRVTVASVAVAALSAGCASQPSHPRPSVSTTGTSSSQSPLPVGTPVAATSAPSTPPPVNERAIARIALAAIVRRLPSGAVSLAVRDADTGDEFDFGAHGGMWTASAYKLLVLETLLLERQDSGTWFSSGELDEITRMIEQSDNVAGYDLFLDAGGNSALADAAHRLGMTHTVIGATDPTFTTTSGRDSLAMLACLAGPGPLQPQSRRFVLHLMRNVESDQRWGVGVLADPGSTFANKNGWLNIDNDNGPGENDDGLWVTNSLGIVRYHGHRLLVSVLTRHNPDLDTGIRLVEKLARIAAPAVLPTAR
jgi:beta-lactamase class A